MNPTIYAIQIRSLRQCVEHLHTIDLNELDRCAEFHGTAEDRALIAVVQRCLIALPRIHG